MEYNKKNAKSCPPLEGGRNLRQEIRGGYQKLAERKYEKITLQQAKGFRKKSTETELKLWNHLKTKQLEKYKFRRQQPMGNFIADFYCAAAKLIIEIDGSHHDDPKNSAYDAERTAFLENAGYRVLRFWNNEIMQNIEGVGMAILDALHTPPDSAIASSAPPQGGGRQGALSC